MHHQAMPHVFRTALVALALAFTACDSGESSISGGDGDGEASACHVVLLCIEAECTNAWDAYVRSCPGGVTTPECHALEGEFYVCEADMCGPDTVDGWAEADDVFRACALGMSNCDDLQAACEAG